MATAQANTWPKRTKIEKSPHHMCIGRSGGRRTSPYDSLCAFCAVRLAVGVSARTHTHGAENVAKNNNNKNIQTQARGKAYGGSNT